MQIGQPSRGTVCIVIKSTSEVQCSAENEAMGDCASPIKVRTEDKTFKKSDVEGHTFGGWESISPLSWRCCMYIHTAADRFPCSTNGGDLYLQCNNNAGRCMALARSHLSTSIYDWPSRKWQQHDNGTNHRDDYLGHVAKNSGLPRRIKACSLRVVFLFGPNGILQHIHLMTWPHQP
jgi:hypothetical protein